MEAARFWRENFRDSARTIAVTPAIAEFMREKEGQNVRPDTLRNLRAKLACLKPHGERPVSALTLDTLKHAINAPGRGPVARNNVRRGLHGFLEWATKQGYCPDNPIARLDPAKVERDEPEVLALVEVQKLIEAAKAHKGGSLLPYVALGIFAALRPTELARLTWEDIDLEQKLVIVTAKIAKLRQRRTVEMSENLVAMLKPHVGRPIKPVNWRKDFDKIKQAAGFNGRVARVEDGVNPKPWPQDIMRHTGISCHFAKHQHEGKTASWARNSPDIVHRHYNGLVRPADVEKFWAVV